jgi:hypothetical protein
MHRYGFEEVFQISGCGFSARSNKHSQDVTSLFIGNLSLALQLEHNQ